MVVNLDARTNVPGMGNRRPRQIKGEEVRPRGHGAPEKERSTGSPEWLVPVDKTSPQCRGSRVRKLDSTGHS